MAVVLFQPEGIVGAFIHYRKKLAGRAPRKAGAPNIASEAQNGSV
jgi:branched-chain amino acid transport system permease protein